MAGETVMRGRVSPPPWSCSKPSLVCVRGGRGWDVGCGLDSTGCRGAAIMLGRAALTAVSLLRAPPCQACAGTSMKGVTLSLFSVLPDLEVSAWHLCWWLSLLPGDPVRQRRASLLCQGTFGLFSRFWPVTTVPLWAFRPWPCPVCLYPVGGQA